MREVGAESEKNVIVDSEAQTIGDAKESVLLSSWQRQIEERQSGGHSIDEWCSMQGISKSSYYYRLRRVRKYLCQVTGVLPKAPREKHSGSGSEQQIVPLKEITDRCSHTPAVGSDESKIEISCGEVKVAFNGSVEKELLQVVLEALRLC